MKFSIWIFVFFLVVLNGCSRVFGNKNLRGTTVLDHVTKTEKTTPNEPLLNFALTPEQIDNVCNTEHDRLASSLNQVASVLPAAASFQNTVLAFEFALTKFRNSLGVASFLKYVSADADLRAASDRCEVAISKTFVEIFAREDLYRVLKAYAEIGQPLPLEDAFLLSEYLSDFIRNGLSLSLEEREKFIEKKKRLVELETEFSKNLVEWEDKLWVTQPELDGLPASYINSLEKNSDGLYKVTLSYPHYFPFVENAKNSDARKRLEFKFMNRGGERNRELLEEAIRLRHEVAQMLGKATHAHYVLEKRMAKKPQEVSQFLQSLVVRLTPKGKENLEELLELKRTELGDPTIREIYSWDWRYYENLLKKTKFQIDSQKIKEYFPLETVVKGMFEIYQTLLGVEFVRILNAPVWHPDVMVFSVRKEGRPVAHFYMDLFPREGKYEHAAAFTLLSGYLKENGCYESPFASIVANFNPPQADSPSLLAHSEVETLFHEFGHIMHQILTTAKYGSYSGTSVKTDFVEAPSQMLENWVWDKSALTKLSGHYQNPLQPLPSELLDKMLKAKLVNVGIRYLRQLAFGIIDMNYHTNASVNSTQIYQDVIKDVMLIPIQEGTLPQASFGHLMGGYDAGYYGYLWSEVFAQDLFTRFETEGLFNPKTGKDYLSWILQPGGLQDPMNLIRGFLGREPNDEAFLKSLGQ